MNDGDRLRVALVGGPMYDHLYALLDPDQVEVVVHADQDRLVAPMYGRRLAAAIPRARLLRVRGGHMTPYTHPGVIAGAIAGLTGPERRNGPGASR